MAVTEMKIDALHQQTDKQQITSLLAELLSESQLDWKFEIEEIAGLALDPNPPSPREYGVIRVDVDRRDDLPSKIAFKIRITEKDGSRVRYDCSFRFYPTRSYLFDPILKIYLRAGLEQISIGQLQPTSLEQYTNDELRA